MRHQPLDLALGEMAPFNCQVYDAWGAFLGCRFHADKLSLPVSYCIYYVLFVHSERIAIAMQDGGIGAGARHEAAVRAARLTSFCLAAEPLYGTPGRRDISISNLHPGLIPENLA